MAAKAAIVKAVVAVASDKRGRVAIATILCSILYLYQKISAPSYATEFKQKMFGKAGGR